MARDFLALELIREGIEHHMFSSPDRPSTLRRPYGYGKATRFSATTLQTLYERYASAFVRWIDARAAYGERREIRAERALGRHGENPKKPLGVALAHVTSSVTALQAGVASAPTLYSLGGALAAGRSWSSLAGELHEGIVMVADSLGEGWWAHAFYEFDVRTIVSIERETTKAEKVAREGDRMRGKVYPYRKGET